MTKKGKKKNVVEDKEKIAENWCFVCKDGGDLVICDYKKCLKSYHSHCVERDDSFFQTADYWACAWHNCATCQRYAYYHCYTCTHAFCRCCLPGEDFLKIKSQYGLCCNCLKLALLIEENKNYDSDGERVDFTDRETCEGLFKEYYEIIKEKEGFQSQDLYAKNQVKVKKKHRSDYGSEDFGGQEFDDDDGDDNNDYDSEPEKKRKKTRNRNRPDRRKSAMQAPIKSNKKEFVGWASRSLIEFLTAIGKSTTDKLSQHDVASIVNEYVKEKKLFNPEKRRIINCDPLLYSLFKRKTISRYRVNDVLEDHFAENHDETEDEELGYDSEGSNADISNPLRRQRRMDTENKTQKKDVKRIGRQSSFASVVVENIKLVYLRRSLLCEILKQPESFEEKVTGCFVRVRSDPHDCRSRRSHQLMQVKGVRNVPANENNTETILLLSDMPGEICMNLLSDDDFTEEECEELRQKVQSGQLERPTVGFLEEKAKTLHKDITKHWMARELALLQNLINRANEKGWRRELFEYLERRKRLQTPSEQLKLLENVPSVIADIREIDSDSGSDDAKSAKGSPKSTSKCNSDVPSDRCQVNTRASGKVPAVKTEVIELLSDEENSNSD